MMDALTRRKRMQGYMRCSGSRAPYAGSPQSVRRLAVDGKIKTSAASCCVKTHGVGLEAKIWRYRRPSRR